MTAMRLNMTLQFVEHLNRAFEAGFRTGQKPVTAEIVAATPAPDFDDLEPRLTRQGDSPKVLTGWGLPGRLCDKRRPFARLLVPVSATWVRLS